MKTTYDCDKAWDEVTRNEMKIGEWLYRIGKTQIFHPEDKLSEIVLQYDDDELDEESLDMVYAAVKPDYQDFMERLRERSGG